MTPEIWHETQWVIAQATFAMPEMYWESAAASADLCEDESDPPDRSQITLQVLLRRHSAQISYEIFNAIEYVLNAYDQQSFSKEHLQTISFILTIV